MFRPYTVASILKRFSILQSNQDSGKGMSATNKQQQDLNTNSCQ